MAKNKDYYVIQDTREKQGYFFGTFGSCKGMKRQKLDTGDYTVEGLEDKLCIERKASVEELSNNLGKLKATFLKEIARMDQFEHKFLVLEFSLEELLEFPKNANMSPTQRAKVRVNGKYLLRTLMEFQVNNDIHVVFCGDKHNAFLFVSSLLKRMSEKYG